MTSTQAKGQEDSLIRAVPGGRQLNDAAPDEDTSTDANAKGLLPSLCQGACRAALPPEPQLVTVSGSEVDGIDCLLHESLCVWGLAS